MLYSTLSLNGTWKMGYQEDMYASEQLPQFQGETIENAVPGYWEDMGDRFAKATFHDALQINPAYTLQQYPMTDYCPDMLLPNILGNFFYSRTFHCEKTHMPATLYFGGVQNAVSVWLNGQFLGRHEGYSTSFEMPIPDGLLKDGENAIVLSVSNHTLDGFDDRPVVGLLSRAACECSGGIWGDVALRVYASPLRDLAVTISQNLKTVNVEVESAEASSFQWAVLDGEKMLMSGQETGNFSFVAENLEKWSPENPKLYTLRLTCGDAVLERAFGVRRLTVDGVQFRLNGEPYYLRGICEHCYYPETVNPNRDIDFYRNVITKVKELGFNYIRFHTHVPTEEYMQAADELGILMHIESPSNTTYAQWQDIVNVCRRHTSTVIYCCGNELQLYEKFIQHLHKCADEVHEKTDSLFSPMSALRGLEYAFKYEPEIADQVVQEPMPHHPGRFALASRFSDLYNSYARGHHSYRSMACDPELVDSWSVLYNKPRLSHEICIDGTYTDLSVKDRYAGTRIGKYSNMLESLEKHLADKGLLERAPLYFKNSCQWQRRNRKYCFEAVRRSENIAGYDFLGPIDTHWHTFGYDVGMMNEFYEMKPGETVENVRMYNSATVLLNNLGRKANFASGDQLSCDILTSCYGVKALNDAQLHVRLTLNGKTVAEKQVLVNGVEGGTVAKLCDFSAVMPQVDKPCEMKLCATLEAENVSAQNRWELYLYPKIDDVIDTKDLMVVDSISETQLVSAMEQGKKVVIFGSEPFLSNDLSFRIALAGRPAGNLATVIADHPIFDDLPHEGFCGWQFESLMEGAKAMIIDSNNVPYEPIIEVASTHKNVIKQAALFEFNMENGKFLACSFKFNEDDPAARWLKNRILTYAGSQEFAPKHTIDAEGLHALINSNVVLSAGNTNFAFNPNDKANSKKKQ